jgi:hypothetical protein
VLTVIACPECHVPAEITEQFSLTSTDGPVEHVVVHCAAGHHFRMAADSLPAQHQQQLAAQRQHRANRPVLIRLRELLRTVQLCVRCRDRVAGFWVSSRDGGVVRRPWCLACCEELGQAHCGITPFGA